MTAVCNTEEEAQLLEKYIDYSEAVKRMLRSHADNKIALDNLKEEYAALNQSMRSVGATDYTKPRVDCSMGNSQDAVINQLLHKQELAQRIIELEGELQRYTKAWQRLTEDERHILKEFFQKGRRPSQEAVDALCDVYGYEKSKIYYLRNEALHKFKRLLVG